MFSSLLPFAIEDRRITALPNNKLFHGHKGHSKQRGPPKPPPTVKTRLSDEQEAIRQKIIDGNRQRKEEERIRREAEERLAAEERIAAQRQQEREQLARREDLRRADNSHFTYWNDVYEMPWFWETHEQGGNEGDEEVEEEKEEDCCICMDRRPDMTLEPCGHKCICATCFNNISQCPLCRHVLKK